MAGEVIIPEKLQSGDEVRIAPSKSLNIISENNIEMAIKRIGSLGLKVSFSKNVKQEEILDNLSNLEMKSMREIQGHLHEIYDMDISPEMISQITNSVLEEVRQWQNRPLDNKYAIVYMDCIHINMKNSDNIIKKQAVYLALGVNMEEKKEILGMWISENEGAKFWIGVITEIKSTGVKKILIACVDGLKGFPEAINSIYPKTLDVKGKVKVYQCGKAKVYHLA